MFSPFGKKVLAVNLSVFALGSLELLGYYYVAPKIIRDCFSSTSLPEKPNYSEPVLVLYEDNKFVFAHRGGKVASESIVNDTFTNNKLLKRAVFGQILTGLSLSAGFAKERRFMGPVVILALASNMSSLFPIAYSAVNLWILSQLVSDGNELVWENLNEARFAQRLEECQDIYLNRSRQFGMFGVLGVIIYCTPFLGSLMFITGKILSLHERLQ